MPVTERVAAILEGSEMPLGKLPPGFTHHQLACAVYGTDEPTAAQLSAIRRAVARLVKAGRAERRLRAQLGLERLDR